MADLTALLALVATGWWDGVLGRAGLRRSGALLAGLLLLGAAFIDIPLGGPAPLLINVGGTLPAVLVIAMLWAAPSPATATRLPAAAAAAACLLFGLTSWTGLAATLLLPVMAAVAAVAIAGPVPDSLLAAAAAPALADGARWLLAWADGLPGTIVIGGGGSFATAVLGTTVAALFVAAGSRLPVRLDRQVLVGGRRRPLG